MISSVSMNSYMRTSALLNQFYSNGNSAPAWPGPMAGPMGVMTTASADAAKFAKAQSSALLGLTNNAKQLKTDAATLDASSPHSVWNQRSLTSSSTSVSGVAREGAKKDTYTVDVTQIAVAQQSAGTALNSTAATTLAAGTQSFAITVGGVPKNISFSVTAGDTNQSVLANMAKSINGAKTGVTASVVNNATSGTSQLVITSTDTGTAKAFTMADAAGSSAVSNTGVGAATRAAADAKYAVNGTGYTSGQNSVTLSADRKVTLNLSAPVTGAKVTVGNDADVITSAITKFADSYNKTMSYLSQNEQYINPILVNTLKQAYAGHLNEFKKAGITAHADGTLAVDQTTLAKSVKSNPTGLEYSLGGASGTAKTSQHMAERIVNSPVSTFAKPSPYNPLSLFSAYNNQRASYQQWSVGSFFNRLF